MTRRRKWIIAALLTVIVIALGAWLGYLIVLPQLIRREVNAAFARAGLGNVTFDISRSTLWAADVERVASAHDKSVEIGSVQIRYSPLDAIGGKLESIVVTNGRIVIDLDKPAAAATGGSSTDQFELPFDRLELVSSRLVLARGGKQTELPVAGTLIRETDDTARLKLTSSHLDVPLTVSGQINPRDASASISGTAVGLDVATLRRLLPDSFTQTFQDAGGRLNVDLHFTHKAGASSAKMDLVLDDVWLTSGSDLSIYNLRGTVAVDNLLVPTTPGKQSIHASRVVLLGNEFVDAALIFELKSRNQLGVEDVRANWGGGVLRAGPLSLDLTSGAFATTLVAERVPLSKLLDMLTRGKAAGEGTVSGSLPLAVNWPHVAIGEGTFRADHPGVLRLGDATADLGEILDSSNPNFATDPVLSELKEDALLTLRDFDFHRLEVSFRRQDGLITFLKIHGEGRGFRPLPLNLNFRIEGLQEALEAYLSVHSRVFKNVKVKGFE